MSLKKLDPNEAFPEIDEELWQYVHSRDNGLCQVCSMGGFEAHHVVYRSQGGKNKANNLILLCKRCHHKEHSIKPEERSFYENRITKNEKKFRTNLI
jgi:5-methylcytosine-specific restriction endonuclease McrA